MAKILSWILLQLHNPIVGYVIMAFVVYGLTEAIKPLIKVFTSKCKNENIRTKLNILIYIIPISLSFVGVYFYNVYFLKLVFNLEAVGIACTISSASSGIYGFFDQIFKKVKKDTEDGTITFNEVLGTKDVTKKELQEIVNKFKKGE